MLSCDIGTVGEGGRTRTSIHAQALENLLHMVLHREETALKNGADFAVGLSFRNPMQHLRLAWSQGQPTARPVHLCLGMSFIGR